MFLFEEILGEIWPHLYIIIFHFFQLYCKNSQLIFEIGRFLAKTPYLESNSLNREQSAGLENEHKTLTTIWSLRCVCQKRWYNFCQEFRVVDYMLFEWFKSKNLQRIKFIRHIIFSNRVRWNERGKNDRKSVTSYRVISSIVVFPSVTVEWPWTFRKLIWKTKILKKIQNNF